MKIKKIIKKDKQWYQSQNGAVSIKTPGGEKDISNVWFNGFIKPLKLIFCNNKNDTYMIICSDNHKFLRTNSEWIEAINLVSGFLFDNNWKFESSVRLDYYVPTFDINVPEEHCYFLENGIITHNSAIILDTSPSIEPVNANIFTQRTRVGSHTIKNKYLEKILVIKSQFGENPEQWVLDQWNSILANDGSVQHLECLNDEEKKIFKTSYEIDQRYIIDQGRIRQEFICQSQSVNLFFKAGVTKKYVNDVHIRAFSNDPLLPGVPMKSLYYCRTSKESKAEKVSGSIVRNELKDYETQVTIEESTCLSCEG